MRGRRFTALVVCAALWSAAVGGWVGLLAMERAFMGDLSCPISHELSEYGEATWGWFPPGVTCTWRGVNYNGSETVVVEHPPVSRLGIAGALLAWGATIVMLGWATRPSNTSSDEPVGLDHDVPGSETAESPTS